MASTTLRCLAAVLLIAVSSAPNLVQAAAMDIFAINPKMPEGNGDKESPWAGEVAVGFAAATGNAESSNLNARVLVGYQTRQWRHAGNLVGYRASDAIGTTAERHVLSGKTDYKFSEKDYLFVTVQVENDRFAGFDRRTSEAVGYGRDFLATDVHKVSGEVGIGARQVKFVNGTSESDAILRLAGNWAWQVSETTSFSQRVVIETGEDNTYTESISALKTNLIGKVFSSLSFTVKRNETVQPGLRKTDTFTTLQLEYKF